MSFQSQRRLVLNASWASVVPDRAVFQPLPVVAQPSVETVIGLKTRAVIRYLLLRRVLGGPVLMLATSTNSIGGPAILLQLAAFAQDACLPSVAVNSHLTAAGAKCEWLVPGLCHQVVAQPARALVALVHSNR